MRILLDRYIELEGGSLNKKIGRRSKRRRVKKQRRRQKGGRIDPLMYANGGTY